MSSHRAKWNYKAPTNHNLNARIKGKTQQGFTILEAIIVLVVAAIIMLAVFVVVPQLQRTQRNSRRVSDARRVWTATQQILGSGGSIDATGTEIIAITGTLKDPTGSAYNLYVNTDPSWAPYNHPNGLSVTPGKGCSSQGSGGTPTGTGAFAVAVNQEKPNSKPSDPNDVYQFFCISN